MYIVTIFERGSNRLVRARKSGAFCCCCEDSLFSFSVVIIRLCATIGYITREWWSYNSQYFTLASFRYPPPPRAPPAFQSDSRRVPLLFFFLLQKYTMYLVVFDLMVQVLRTSMFEQGRRRWQPSRESTPSWVSQSDLFFIRAPAAEDRGGWVAGGGLTSNLS